MGPREIIAATLYRWIRNSPNDWGDACQEATDAVLKALDEQGMAVLPKPRNTPIADFISFKPLIEGPTARRSDPALRTDEIVIYEGRARE
jgi:hypothetical protein